MCLHIWVRAELEELEDVPAGSVTAMFEALSYPHLLEVGISFPLPFSLAQLNQD